MCQELARRGGKKKEGEGEGGERRKKEEGGERRKKEEGGERRKKEEGGGGVSVIYVSAHLCCEDERSHKRSCDAC